MKIMGAITTAVLALVIFLVGISNGLPGRDGYKSQQPGSKNRPVVIQPIVTQRKTHMIECYGGIVCNNDQCAVPCNGIKECPHGEDEKRCKDQCEVLPDCKDKDELLCPDKTTCASVCDGKEECKSAEDEPMCLQECGKGELMCGASDGCGKPCDGKIQCEDKSDEQACPCDSPAITNCLCGIIYEVDSDDYDECLAVRSDDVFQCCRLDVVNIASRRNVFHSPAQMKECVEEYIGDSLIPFRDYDKCILSL